MNSSLLYHIASGAFRPFGPRPQLSSSRLDWKGFHLEQHRLSLDANEVIWLRDTVLMTLQEPFTLESSAPDGPPVTGLQNRRLLPGQLILCPAQSVSHMRSHDPAALLLISLEPEFLTLASCGRNGGNIRLRPACGFEDRFIEGACTALQREVERGGTSGLPYCESLASTLAVHLVSQYGTKSPQPPPGSKPVDFRIQKVIRYIHDNLPEAITLKAMGGVANMSPFHFGRYFKRHTGLSPYQFIIRQRIERAKQLLMQGDQSIASIAALVGFYDQSHFAMSFKKLCGTTPGYFARHWHSWRDDVS